MKMNVTLPNGEKEARDIRVFVAIISHDGTLEKGTVFGLLQAVAMGLISPEDIWIQDQAGQEVARNLCAHRFRASECTHILWLDRDIVWVADHLMRLLASGHDFCASPYHKKTTVENSWVVNAIPGRENEAPDKYGFREVETAGTGFLLMAKQIFEDLIAAGRAPLRRYIAGGPLVYQFVSQGAHPEEPELVQTDDWWLCKEAHAVGYRLMLDTALALAHTGKIEFPIQMAIAEELASV